MSKTSGQNLSLGKLKRAVDGTDSYTTANTSLASQNASSTETSMSSFSIDSVDSVTGYTYLWEQTSEDYTVNFSGTGELFLSKIANRTENFTWTKTGNLGVTFGGADYIASVTAPSITNTDGAIAGTFNQSGSIQVKYNDDGQSDGFNDHATNYNTNVTKAIEVVDTYGGVPTCLLFGSPVSKSDGSVVNVEDLNIGDEILTVLLPNATDEDEGTDWKNDTFNQSGSFTQHSASVQRVMYEFSEHYYNINNGQELITGEHHMLYRISGSEDWTWKTAPNFEIGNYLMDKQGNEVLISSLQQHIDPDGYEVVQLDVEPDDFYIGQTFLVHNKGSNSEPTYPTTQWSTAPGDETFAGSLGDTVTSDGVKTIGLTNGSGTTTISFDQTSAGAVTFKVAWSTTGDPGGSGTDNGGSGFVTFPVTGIAFTTGTLYMRFQAVCAASGDGTGTGVVSFTNNGVTNSDVDITLNFT
jgi:hypothetical protein